MAQTLPESIGCFPPLKALSILPQQALSACRRTSGPENLRAGDPQGRRSSGPEILRAGDPQGRRDY
ncbi:hypothetical protein D4764_08G0008900 [Takifugu flavidus]|uniref:Uncharacterized protein n=1 Tax=Takifugu flavidus TaxID=433684 RepID=A0A5C6MPV3_9TELE|nr:hypothetical protein D4764_08G0008900 [Takifugu flavidus]